MKQFLKFRLLKLILTLIIIIIPFIGMLLYNQSAMISKQTLKIEASFGVEILYHISNIILFPVRAITAPFQKLFGENYFRNISGELPSSLPYVNLLLSSIFLLLLLIESYILSCFIYFIINKIQNRKGQPLKKD